MPVAIAADMKNANERSLNAARQDTNRLLRNVHAACSSLQANLKAADTQNQVNAHLISMSL